MANIKYKGAHMEREKLKEKLLKLAREAFETASTLKEEERIEVYLLNGNPQISNVLNENDSIIYEANRILCYQINGYPYLEEEIKTWIDYARIIQQSTEDVPLQASTGVEKSIKELIDTLAKTKGVQKDAISSYEIFANMPMNLLGTIEQEIIEYWWSAAEEENAKLLAIAQIEEALHSL